eukprot:63804-Prymnesium_polylepis.1
MLHAAFRAAADPPPAHGERGRRLLQRRPRGERRPRGGGRLRASGRVSGGRLGRCARGARRGAAVAAVDGQPLRRAARAAAPL